MTTLRGTGAEGARHNVVIHYVVTYCSFLALASAYFIGFGPQYYIGFAHLLGLDKKTSWLEKIGSRTIALLIRHAIHAVTVTA